MKNTKKGLKMKNNRIRKKFAVRDEGLLGKRSYSKNKNAGRDSCRFPLD